MHRVVRIILKLSIDECSHRIPDCNHAFDPVLPCHRGFHRLHNAVLAVVHLTVHKRKRKVAHSRVCRKNTVRFFSCQFVLLDLGYFGVDVADRFRQQFRKLHLRKRLAGGLRAERTRFRYHTAEYHIRMLDKVLVHLDAVFVFSEVTPIGIALYHAVALLKKDNIRDCFRSRRRLKGRIRQADCSEEVCAGGDIPSDGRVLLIQRPLACNKGNDTSGTHLIKRFGEKIIVNEEVVPIIPLILHLELSERNIADCDIKETVRVCGVFKSRDRNVLPLIQLLCNTTGDAVKLHTVKTGFAHALRHKSHKVSDAAGRFQNVAACKAHIFKCFVDCLDDDGRCIKSRQSGFSGGGILGRSKKLGKLPVFLRPAIFVFIKGIRKPTPTGVLRKDLLFFRGCDTFFILQRMQKTDGGNVAAVFLFRSAHAEIVVCNTEVVLFIKRDFRVKCRDCLFRLRLFLLQGRHCRFFAVRFRRIARKHPVSVSPVLRFVGITCSLGFPVYHVALNLPVDRGKVLCRKARIVRLRIKGSHCFRKERCSCICKLAIRHFTDTVNECVSLFFVREISAVAYKVLIGFSEYGERKRVRHKLPACIRIGIVVNPIKLFSC